MEKEKEEKIQDFVLDTLAAFEYRHVSDSMSLKEFKSMFCVMVSLKAIQYRFCSISLEYYNQNKDKPNFDKYVEVLYNDISSRFDMTEDEESMFDWQPINMPVKSEKLMVMCWYGVDYEKIKLIGKMFTNKFILQKGGISKEDILKFVDDTRKFLEAKN